MGTDDTSKELIAALALRSGSHVPAPSAEQVDAARARFFQRIRSEPSPVKRRDGRGGAASAA